MVQFIKTFEERVAAEAVKVEDYVKNLEAQSKQRIVDTFDNAIHNIEVVLVDEGLALDKEANDALAVIKFKLSGLKDELGGLK